MSCQYRSCAFTAEPTGCIFFINLFKQMKKIIAAFDGLKYSGATQDHSIAVAKGNEAVLVGVFLEDLSYHSYGIYELITEEGGGLDTKRSHLDKKDAKTRARSIDAFEKACKAAGIKYLVHKDRKAAIRELIKESIYADLLVIDSRESFSHHPQEVPTHFIHQLLPHVQCPVLVVSGPYQPISQSVLLFDGSPVAMHAFKMLSYTFPKITSFPSELYAVLEPSKAVAQPDGFLIREFMQRHFTQVTFTFTRGTAETEILKFLKKRPPGTLVVLGAYQRSFVSRFFRKSMADTLMKDVKIPLFIAHSI